MVSHFVSGISRIVVVLSTYFWHLKALTVWCKFFQWLKGITNLNILNQLCPLGCKLFCSGLIKGSLASLALLLAVACTPQEQTYPTLNGENVALSRLQGRVVFINYWAEWCRPCRVEIPELNAFATQHEDEITVLSVNFDGVSGEALVDQVAAMGIEFDTLLVDPRSTLAAPPSVALPETLVIGRDGKLYKVLLGPQTLDGLNEMLPGIP